MVDATCYTASNALFGIAISNPIAREQKLRPRQVEIEAWKDCFDNPLLWWDNCFDKRHTYTLDFKRKVTQKGLWLESKSIPVWVLERLKLHNATNGS